MLKLEHMPQIAKQKACAAHKRPSAPKEFTEMRRRLATLAKEIKPVFQLASESYSDDADCFVAIGTTLQAPLLNRRACDLVGDCHAQFRHALQELDTTLREQAKQAYLRGIDLCESLMQRRIFPWLLCQSYNNFVKNPKLLLPGESDQLGVQEIAVIPQLTIGRHKIDFALTARIRDKPKFVVIECFGQEQHNIDCFHDPKKIDVNLRDAIKIKELLAHERVRGVLVVTAADIGRDPRAAARECANFVTACWFYSLVQKPTNYAGISEIAPSLVI